MDELVIEKRKKIKKMSLTGVDNTCCNSQFKTIARLLNLWDPLVEVYVFEHDNNSKNQHLIVDFIDNNEGFSLH